MHEASSISHAGWLDFKSDRAVLGLFGVLFWGEDFLDRILSSFLILHHDIVINCLFCRIIPSLRRIFSEMHSNFAIDEWPIAMRSFSAFLCVRACVRACMCVRVCVWGGGLDCIVYFSRRHPQLPCIEIIESILSRSILSLFLKFVWITSSIFPSTVEKMCSIESIDTKDSKYKKDPKYESWNTMKESLLCLCFYSTNIFTVPTGIYCFTSYDKLLL